MKPKNNINSSIIINLNNNILFNKKKQTKTRMDG